MGFQSVKSRTKSTIEIKGKRYDSTTGLPVLSDIFAPVQPVRNDIKAGINHALPADSTSPVTKPARQHQPHGLASSASRHQRQPSRTLSRKSVKRPDVRQKPAIKTSKEASVKLVHQPVSSLIKQSAGTINRTRAEHASNKPKSPSISHFSSQTNAVLDKVIAPKASPAQPQERGRVFDIKPRTNTQKPSLAAAAPAVAITTPVINGSHFDKMLDASEETNKHRYLEYTPVKKRTGLSRLSRGGRRALAFGLTGLAVLLLAGYAVFLNKANIELQLADAKAGINATLPSYKPSGFSVGKLSYRTGLVAINFISNDGHNYKLTQQASRLDSNALGQKLAAANQTDYQTLHASGQTIFAKTTGTSASATWVSGGILYQLEGNASLSQDQLAKIASST